jgi:iron complex transport system substrate-binding protein
MRLTFISLLVIALFLTACGNTASYSGITSEETPQGTSSEKVVIDAMGHEVKIPANPQRIIASYLEDHLVTLGVTPVAQWSVATDIQDYLQTNLQGVPTINYDLPPEAVVSFNPDLIIIGSESSVQKGLYEQYSQIAPTYVLGDGVNKDWRKSLLKIGELLNKTDAAEQALKDYDKKAAAMKAQLQEAIGSKSAAILWLTQKKFYLVDETVSSGAVLYGDLGMKPPNLVADLDTKGSWNPITLEKLAELNADAIFMVNSDKSTGTEDTLNSPIWKELPAVKAGHVYELSSSSSWLYSGVIAGEKIMDDVGKSLGK